MRDQCGRKELEWADTTSTQCLYTCAMLPTMLGCGTAPRCVAFALDMERLAAAKTAAAASGDVPYVSTNDVLTSAFFNETGARIGMMGMDMRGRLDSISGDMAGNYVTVLAMDSDTFGTPAAVRKMLSATPHQTTGRPLPSCCGWMACRANDSGRFAMATNWASFAKNIPQIDGCELEIHLPCHNPAHCLYDLMVPFSAGKDKQGVMCWTVNSDEDGLKAALPVGDCISRDLFPKV